MLDFILNSPIMQQLCVHIALSSEWHGALPITKMFDWTRRKLFLQNFISSRDGPIKGIETRQR